jgi:hypothetical protein
MISAALWASMSRDCVRKPPRFQERNSSECPSEAYVRAGPRRSPSVSTGLRRHALLHSEPF